MANSEKKYAIKDLQVEQTFSFMILLKYVQMVGERIGKENALELLAKLFRENRAQWFKKNRDRITGT